MQRRHILASFAAASAALVVAPALAQSSSDAMVAMGEAEMKHVKETGTVGALSLATSRVAMEKASEAAVKTFATFETAEQETIADVLMSMKEGAAKPEGALKKPTKDEVEAMLDATGKEELSKLEAASGKAFDTAYVTAQIAGHKKLLTIQEDYLTSGQNREHLSVAKLARATIKEHIARLEDLQSMLG